MPDQKTLERAQEDARKGKAPSTQAGEFVKEEMDHIREGKHGARSPQQAIAIGLSKARRAGVKLPPPGKGKTSEATRTQAQRDVAKGQSPTKTKTSAKRSRAVSKALKREGKSAASHSALSKQATRSARQRGSAARKQAAKKAVSTKGAAGRKQAAKKSSPNPSETGGVKTESRTEAQNTKQLIRLRTQFPELVPQVRPSSGLTWDHCTL